MLKNAIFTTSYYGALPSFVKGLPYFAKEKDKSRFVLKSCTFSKPALQGSLNFSATLPYANPLSDTEILGLQ